MIKCRRCGGEIVFLPSRSGKMIACDPGLVPFWADVRGKVSVLTEDGEEFRCRLDEEPNEITNVAHIVHWQSCVKQRRKK